MDTRVWIEALRRHVIPALGDGWELAGDSLVRAPVGWTAARVVPQPSAYGPAFFLHAQVQLLAEPEPESYTCGFRLGRWEAPATLAGYSSIAAQVVDAVVSRAAPFFDRYATLDGYLSHLRERLAELDPGQEWIDVLLDEELAYANLLLGDLPAAEVAAGYAERAAEQNRRDPQPLDWVEEAAGRVARVVAAARRDHGEAREILAGHARANARQLRLTGPAAPDLGR
ncbi:hypothetical protein ACSNOB_09615 [Micromonospora sp. URMC 106]|uniref:hypothetical protein n=1 Tax=Micromonospora sp. URMC 106 TaxID=3423408 RepID=UPI003F1B6D92